MRFHKEKNTYSLDIQFVWHFILQQNIMFVNILQILI